MMSMGVFGTEMGENEEKKELLWLRKQREKNPQCIKLKSVMHYSYDDIANDIIQTRQL